MIICYERNQNGSYTFYGYLKTTYYDYTLTQCKAKHKQAIRASGYTGSVTFVRL